MTRLVRLRTGAEARLRNAEAPVAAVLVNGGTARAVPGTWSATSELLATELAPRFPAVAFAELRYRVKSWNELASCMADAHAVLELMERTSLLVGFSMGGAVSIGVAADERAQAVLGLAPWIPEQLSLEGLSAKRLDIVHGAWDRPWPGIPGVTAASSRRGFERARALGIEGSYTVIERGLHGAAVRGRGGRLLRLPRWRAWVDLVAGRLEDFVAEASV